MLNGALNKRLARLEQVTAPKVPLTVFVVVADGHSKEEIDAFLRSNGAHQPQLRPVIIINRRRPIDALDRSQRPLAKM